MPEMNLTFPSLAIGSHETPWDLKILLYDGAACIPRKEAINAICMGVFGDPKERRSYLVFAFHEAIKSMLNKGRSRALIIRSLEVLWRFYAWADKNNKAITEENVIDSLKDWSEHQIHRYQVKKEISALHGYRQVTQIANLIAGALKMPGSRPGAHLLYKTRMRKPSTRKNVLTSKAEKQNLNRTFDFGHALKKICDTLDIESVRGPLPVLIEIDSSRTMVLSGTLHDPLMEVESIKDNTVRRAAERARAPLKLNESLFGRHHAKRTVILNLRIESEFLIFIAQTGMNSTQAASLQREDYRWKSNGNDLEVFRVYKGRRGGEAVFRCFKSYKEHLQRYLKWLDDAGFSEHDKRLFPFQNRVKIPAKGSKIQFCTAREAFKRVGMQFFGPQDLRKTRVNWLLRRSRDLELTAEQMAHDKEVLLRDYEMPHHQAATIEILSFHRATDPTFFSPGPGLCLDSSHIPVPISAIKKEAPKPDCVSPEGCLFCAKHRDIMSADYCWKLASHAMIKNMETNLYKPSAKQGIHPSYHVIERINQKLHAIASGSKVRATWVKDAQDSIRAGRYHPHWMGHIQLLEAIL